MTDFLSQINNYKPINNINPTKNDVQPVILTPKLLNQLKEFYSSCYFNQITGTYPCNTRNFNKIDQVCQLSKRKAKQESISTKNNELLANKLKKLNNKKETDDTLDFNPKATIPHLSNVDVQDSCVLENLSKVLNQTRDAIKALHRLEGERQNIRSNRLAIFYSEIRKKSDTFTQTMRQLRVFLEDYLKNNYASYSNIIQLTANIFDNDTIIKDNIERAIQETLNTDNNIKKSETIINKIIEILIFYRWRIQHNAYTQTNIQARDIILHKDTQSGALNTVIPAIAMIQGEEIQGFLKKENYQVNEGGQEPFASSMSDVNSVTSRITPKNLAYYELSQLLQSTIMPKVYPVIIDDELFIFMEKIEGRSINDTEVYSVLQDDKKIQATDIIDYDSIDKLIKMHILDILALNLDRHPGNYHYVISNENNNLPKLSYSGGFDVDLSFGKSKNIDIKNSLFMGYALENGRNSPVVISESHLSILENIKNVIEKDNPLKYYLDTEEIEVFNLRMESLINFYKDNPSFIFKCESIEDKQEFIEKYMACVGQKNTYASPIKLLIDKINQAAEKNLQKKGSAKRSLITSMDTASDNDNQEEGTLFWTIDDTL